MLPPIYPSTIFNFLGKDDQNYLYFCKEEEALYFLIDFLYADVILVSSCISKNLLKAIKLKEVEYNFIDLDENLDFDLKDLENMLEMYKGKKIALIPTSLCNAKIRDYKRLYPFLTVIEDLTQSLPKYRQNSDYAIYSFDKYKLISTGQGAVLDGCMDKKYYNSLPLDNSFLKDYIKTFLYKYFIKYTKNLPIYFDGKNVPKEQNITKIEPKRVDDSRKKWISNNIYNYNSKHRRKVSDIYLDLLPKNLTFDLPKGRDYLRFPIKKRIDSYSFTYMDEQESVYKEAVEKRGIKFEVVKSLIKECSFLPTHELVTYEDTKSIIDLVKNG